MLISYILLCVFITKVNGVYLFNKTLCLSLLIALSANSWSRVTHVDFIVDKANGDYNRVSFSKLQLSK